MNANLIDLSCLTELETVWLEDTPIKPKDSPPHWILGLVSRLHGEKLKKLTITILDLCGLRGLIRGRDFENLDIVLSQPRFRNLRVLKVQLADSCRRDEDHRYWEQAIRSALRMTAARSVRIIFDLDDGSDSSGPGSVPGSEGRRSLDWRQLRR